MSELFTRIQSLTITGQGDELNGLVRRAMNDGYAASAILEKGLIPGMNEVGRRMKSGEMFIPEVLLSAGTMQAALEILKPNLTDIEAAGAGTIVIGTVMGDLHDIGKNLVAMMLEGAGFRVIDLGVDVKPETFVEAIKTHKPVIVGLSALLTTTMINMKKTIAAIEAAGLRGQVKIMAGGAPVTQRLVLEDLGADGYGANASEAVDRARALLG
ncbi:MAG: corrinoid protein [Thermodesulfobacteriota bacterium]